MNCEWDEDKNAQNISKHGLNFADIQGVFTSPLLVDLDTREDYGEDRMIGIGIVQNTVIVVVFAECPNGTIRIISARKALKYERIKFEQFLRDELGNDQEYEG
ncbi:MAG: BrnT family toxin [Blastocatellia bacterium]